MRVCPWWLGYLLTCPARRFFEDPSKILGPYVRTGMTVLEPGPGMGFFTMALAQYVGDSGRVVAVDIQLKMLAALERRAVKAGLRRRVETRLARPGSMEIPDLAGQVDFALVFAVVHEMPDEKSFFAELSASLKNRGTALFVEPAGHVNAGKFEEELRAAAAAGLVPIDRPKLSRNHAALLGKR